MDKVAVAYIDADGDQVTLSSQEELLDYYVNCHKAGEAVKFNVVDLGKLRSSRNSSALRGDFVDLDKDHASPAGGLGAMGPTMVFEVDDWQRLPHIFPMGDVDDLLADSEEADSDVGHAYVETVVSEESHSKKRSGGTHSPSLLSNASKSSVNTIKGKGRETAIESLVGTSTASLIEEEAPSAPTLHVNAASNASSPHLTTGDGGWRGQTSVQQNHRKRANFANVMC